MQKIVETLKKIEAFCRLPSVHLEKLAANMKVESYPTGAKIISKGEEGDCMYIILSGEVKIPIYDAFGRQKFVARLREGDFFGEMALLTGDPRSADVYAVNPVEVAVMDKKIYRALVQKYPSIARFLTEILAKRLSESDIMLSKTVGKYRLLDELGRGGMSIVYSAYHPGLQRTVAIKMLSHQLVFDDEFRQRFQNEARIIASLKHPNIVEVYDLEEAYATYFIIMEYIDGTTLEKMIETSGRLDSEMARSILIQVASALAYAHEHGIVHRDVKPSNIMIDREGQVKLMDFGICRMEKNDPMGEEEEIIGTAPYMAPEQIQGLPVDGRCDLYALGITAFEMLTGVLPFDAADSMRIFEMHLTKKVPDPRKWNPSIPEDLVEFIKKALEKNPDRRFSNLKEVKEFLSQGVSEKKRVQKVLTLSYSPSDKSVADAFLQELKKLARKYSSLEIGLGNIQQGF